MPARRAEGPLLTARSRAGVTRHRIVTPLWSAPPLRIAFLSDFHVVAPWTTPDDIAAAVALAAVESPDVAILGGDFLAERKIPGRRVSVKETIAVLSGLAAPFGTYAVLGNHDWKNCVLARATGGARNSVIEALAASPIRLLRNEAVALGDTGAWLAGFDSQSPNGHKLPGFHDPNRAFADIPADAPVVLAAHEPDWFAGGDRRVVLQLSGHTHAGQGNLWGWRPLIRSSLGRRFAWGHHEDGERHLVVSGGIGFTGLPLRLAAPPEVTIVDVTGPDGLARPGTAGVS